MEKVRVLIDTDLGDDTDDAAALMLALACPQIEIVGITTVFKDTKKRREMVKDLLRIHGRTDIPVYAGHGRALVDQKFKEEEEPIQYPLLSMDGAWRTEVGNQSAAAGQGGSASPSVEASQPATASQSAMASQSATDSQPTAVSPSATSNQPAAEDFLLQKLEEYPDVILLSMGPMTNLAMACRKNPGRMEHARIIGMGGAFLSSAPEWNIVCDPEAADIVMRTCKNVTLMGLDVTKYLRIGEDRLERWRARKDPAMEYYLKGVELFQKKTGYPVTFHDVLLVAYLIDPEVVTLKKGDFAVELNGTLTRGTMADRSNYYEVDPEIDSDFTYAVSLDLPRFFEILDRYF